MAPKDDDKKKNQQETREEMAANYGWALAVLKSNGELWRLFLTAVEKEYSVARFTSALRNTKWYKTHSDTWREDYVLQKTDPKTWRKRYEAKSAQIADLAAQLGSVLPKGTLDRITRQAMAYQWEESSLRNALANYVSQVGGAGTYGGEAGQAEEELRQYALDMGVTLSDASVRKWLQAIVRRSGTIEQYKGWIRNQASTSFSGLAEYIKQGQTVRTLAEPYIQSMASILELNPASLTLTDPTIRKALQGAAGKDGTYTMQSLTQFEDQLRQDPRWLATHNAKNTMADLGQGILRDFGLI